MTSRSSAPFRWRTRPSHSRKSSSRRTGRSSHTTASAVRLCTPWWPRQSITATTRAKWKPVAYPKSAASWSTSQVGLLEGVGTWRAREVSVLESRLGSESWFFCSCRSEWMCSGRAVVLVGRKSVQSEPAVRCGAWGCRLGHQIPAGPLSTSVTLSECLTVSLLQFCYSDDSTAGLL